MTPTPHNLLQEALAELGHGRLIWQITAIAVSVGLAWLFATLVESRAPARASGRPPRLGRALFPLFCLLLLLVSKALLQHWIPVALIQLLIPLALVFTVLRIASQILRIAFKPSGLLTLIEHSVSWVVLAGLALHLTGLRHEVIAVLDEFSITLGQQRISLLLVLEGALSMAVTVIAALWIGRLIESRIMRSETLDLNLRLVFSKITRAMLIVFGVLIALPLVGIDITFLSIFGGALGVGIGFGLQKIASNYISGFIMLLDHSIRIGDLVSVDNRLGQVSQINNRYTVIKALDGTEAIIPNETMITSTVINHSFTNRQIRVGIPVLIGYGSPVEQAMSIMTEVARSFPRVLQEPEPAAYLKEFGDNGLLLELVVWISDPEEGQLTLRSAINLEMWRRFKCAGIDIPYPQREVRIIAAPPVADHPAAGP